MRPHRLRVTAFGAFADTEQVSFDDLEGLFLLHGETGAGKTTLLDAIAFALYGRVPGERGNAKRLRSDHAAADRATEVQLEATIGDRRLLITRKPEQERPKRSGAGTVKEPASVRLEERSAAGTWELKSSRVGEADAEIALLMGMSAEQFFQVVLLPQGQFAQFLHAKAQDKEMLLRKLFGTDRFGHVEAWLADRRRTASAEVAAAAEVVGRLVAQVAQAAGVPVPGSAPAPDTAQASAPNPAIVPGEPWQASWAAGLAAAAAAERDVAAALVEDRKRDLDAALDAKSKAGHHADRQRRRREALHKQAELEEAAPAIARLRAEAAAAVRAAQVAPLLDAADRAATDAVSASRAEERARAAIPEGSATPRDAGSEALRAAEQDQRVQLGALDALRAVARQAAEEDANAATANAQATELEQALAAAGAEAARHQEARPRAASDRDAASQAASALHTAQAAADKARRIAADAAALAKQLAKWDRLRETHREVLQNALSLRKEADRVRQARIDGMSAELAATLFDGDECPVCGSLDHPNPKEPTFELVSHEREAVANAAAEDAARAAEQAGRKAAAVEAVVGDLVRRLAADGFAAVTSAATWAPGTGASVPLPDAIALAHAIGQAEADAERLGAEAARLKAAAAALGDLQQALDALDEAIATDKVTLEKLAEQRKAALADAEAATRRAAERRAELRAQLGSAPDLDTALQAVRQLAAALAAAADAADESVRTAADARDAAERALNAAIAAGFSTVTTAHPGTATTAPSGSAAASHTDTGAIAAAREAARDDRWRNEAADLISRHEAESKAVATLLAAPDLADVELDPPAPVAETTATADRKQQEHAAAVDAYSRARYTAEQLALLQPRVEDALADLKPKEECADQVRQLADLAEGRGANQYHMTLSSFVLAARLEEVAAAASQRLLTMTAGRYSLVHTDARRRGGGKSGLGLLACDSWTGVDRDTSTLSGGETFLASLALALGLADVVTAEAAGTPMEALFVDEGFGTLDEDTLEEVMNVLDGLREGGRIVGIVSHVAELRQRIPAQVHVRKGHHGSHVQVIAG